MLDERGAAVVDERHADRLCQALAGRRVGDCLSGKAGPPSIAEPDDTALEVAALMARVHSPLVSGAEKARAEAGGRKRQGTRLLGVITASHLLHELLAVAEPSSTTRPGRESLRRPGEPLGPVRRDRAPSALPWPELLSGVHEPLSRAAGG
ncbi:hypothetical protein ABT063_25580 [Streptomyces sp. NPDC002838]|uniref:hypothetical protein n=1 Tax=Streptomyces sp. NPDC002838 TaxID=3154436 RepID=UPI00332FD881